MEQVALDQLRRVDQLPVQLPTLADDRLRAIAALLRAEPSDEDGRRDRSCAETLRN